MTTTTKKTSKANPLAGLNKLNEGSAPRADSQFRPTFPTLDQQTNIWFMYYGGQWLDLGFGSHKGYFFSPELGIFFDEAGGPLTPRFTFQDVRTFFFPSDFPFGVVYQLNPWYYPTDESVEAMQMLTKAWLQTESLRRGQGDPKHLEVTYVEVQSGSAPQGVDYFDILNTRSGIVHRVAVGLLIRSYMTDGPATFGNRLWNELQWSGTV